AARARARTHARSMRTNAEASLARMRDEPATDRRLLALADRLFANANRLVRASMLLEAALQEPAPPPERDALLAFGAGVEARIDALAASLRDGRPPVFASLRADERELAGLLADD